MIRSMVSHDFARGTIRGLPPSVVGAARKTGKLPEGAIPALMVDSWNAVRAQQKNAFVGLTVADVQRMRWGFETEGQRREAWEVFAGKGAVPRSVPIANWKCACLAAGSANGQPCGWRSEGVIEDAGAWIYDATHDLCEAKGRCTRSWPCRCHETGYSAEPWTADELTTACGLDGQEDRGRADVECFPSVGECECRVWCVEEGRSYATGKWGALPQRGVCPTGPDTAGDDTIIKGACEKPRLVALQDDFEGVKQGLKDAIEAYEHAKEWAGDMVEEWEELTGVPFWGDSVVMGTGGVVGSANDCRSASPMQYPCQELIDYEYYDRDSRGLNYIEARRKMVKKYGYSNLKNKDTPTDGPCRRGSGYELGWHESGRGVAPSLGCCPCCDEEDNKSYWLCKDLKD